MRPNPPPGNRQWSSAETTSEVNAYASDSWPLRASSDLPHILRSSSRYLASLLRRRVRGDPLGMGRAGYAVDSRVGAGVEVDDHGLPAQVGQRHLVPALVGQG